MDTVGCREGRAVAVGVGEPAGGRLDDCHDGISTGDDKSWITLVSSLFVLIAADWIIGTWWARFGNMAGMKRGVKGTMTSCAKPRNSASHCREVDC